MIAPQDPPGFVVRVEVQKAAADNGFRLEHGTGRGWMRFGSTTAEAEIWLAGTGPGGPWLLAVSRADIAAELAGARADIAGAPGAACFAFERLASLYAALDRVWRLGVSLPRAPLARFEAGTSGMPRTTEAERLVLQRIGQDVFRDALMAYWGGRCPLTGITDPALLRASHIVPWAECDSDAQRLDVHNGLLLSALWDAAFDAGLVSFGDDGVVLSFGALSPPAAAALRLDQCPALPTLTAEYRRNLAWHRRRHCHAR